MLSFLPPPPLLLPHPPIVLKVHIYICFVKLYIWYHGISSQKKTWEEREQNRKIDKSPHLERYPKYFPTYDSCFTATEAK